MHDSTDFVVVHIKMEMLDDIRNQPHIERKRRIQRAVYVERNSFDVVKHTITLYRQIAEFTIAD